MKSIRFIIILVYLCFGLDVWGQSGCGQQPETYINKVSVDPESGRITISWDLLACQNPQDVEKFMLYWYTTEPSPSYKPFATVSANDRSYVFDYDEMKLQYLTEVVPDPCKTSVGFSVSAVLKGVISIPRYSFRNHNIQVTNSYDSCRSQITLNWYRYQGWLENTPPYKPLVSYNLMRIPEGGSVNEAELISTRGPNDTTWTFKVEDNKTYTYYIEARRDGETATSYVTTRTTDMPVAPSFITAESTQYNDDGFPEVSFKIDEDAEMHRYHFRGSERAGVSVDWLGTFDIYGDTILTDTRIREKTYYYVLEAQHEYECRGATATSNTATALWLSFKQEGLIDLLRWDPYQYWGEDDQREEVQYDVYRQIGDEEPENIASISDPDPTAYDDDMTSVLITGDVCYWIIAKPKSYSPENTAISNRICVKPESNIFIPEAFTPNFAGNVAGLNSEFKPFFSYPPKDYTLYLYDLNGAKVFETKDMEAGWNGRLLNGKPASEGVYVYYLIYRTERGRLVEKKGTFALILLK